MASARGFPAFLPEQPSAEPRNQDVGTDLEPARRVLDRKARQIEDNGKAADKNDRGDGLREGRRKGQHDPFFNVSLLATT